MCSHKFAETRPLKSNKRQESRTFILLFRLNQKKILVWEEQKETAKLVPTKAKQNKQKEEEEEEDEDDRRWGWPSEEQGEGGESDGEETDQRKRVK